MISEMADVGQSQGGESRHRLLAGSICMGEAYRGINEKQIHTGRNVEAAGELVVTDDEIT